MYCWAIIKDHGGLGCRSIALIIEFCRLMLTCRSKKLFVVFCGRFDVRVSIFWLCYVTPIQCCCSDQCNEGFI